MKSVEKQQLIIIGIALAVILGFCGFWFYPLAGKSMDIKEIRTLQQTATAQVEQYNTLVPVLRKQAEQLTEETADFDIRIPDNQQFADLWQQIAVVMTTHNLEDQIVEPGVEIIGESIIRIPLTIKCSGRISQIFDMLKSLDSIERTISLEKVELLNDGDYGGKLKLNAIANVYYRSGL